MTFGPRHVWTFSSSEPVVPARSCRVQPDAFDGQKARRDAAGLCPSCSSLRTGGRERLPSPNNLPSIRGNLPGRRPSQSGGGGGRERRRTQVPMKQISREILHPPPPHLSMCRPINRLHQLQRKRLIARFFGFCLWLVTKCERRE